MTGETSGGKQGLRLASLAWQCLGCGEYHVFDDPVVRPEACTRCGGVELLPAGPADSVWATLPESGGTGSG